MIELTLSTRKILLTHVVSIILVIFLLATVSPAIAAEIRTLQCTKLKGIGSYKNPYRIGTINRPTVVRNCRPLSSGKGYNVRYFRFNLPKQPSINSYVMTYYLPNSADSGVHPRLIDPPYTVKGSLDARYYYDGTYEGFYHFMYDLHPGNGWLLGAEKLSSPLGSIRTAKYNIFIVP